MTTLSLPYELQMTGPAALPIGYFLVGAALRYIDLAYDEGRFAKRHALLLSLPAGLLMGALMAADSTSAAILMSIGLAALVCGKVDNIAFKLGMGTAIVTPALFMSRLAIDWPPLTFLFIAACVDELGNDWADKTGKGTTGPMRAFMSNRLALPAAILALGIAGKLGLIYVVSTILLDAGYKAVGMINGKSEALGLHQPQKGGVAK